MPLYKITTKREFKDGDLLIKKGLSVQVLSFSTNPLYHYEGNDVNNTFLRVYGIDLKSQGLFSTAFLEVEEIYKKEGIL